VLSAVAARTIRRSQLGAELLQQFLGATRTDAGCGSGRGTGHGPIPCVRSDEELSDLLTRGSVWSPRFLAVLPAACWLARAVRAPTREHVALLRIRDGGGTACLAHDELDGGELCDRRDRGDELGGEGPGAWATLRAVETRVDAAT